VKGGGFDTALVAEWFGNSFTGDRLASNSRGITLRSSLMPVQTTILGDGQMALAMADALAAGRKTTAMWSPFPADAETLGRTRISPRMPEFRLPEAVAVTADAKVALQACDFIISAIPTQFLRNVWKTIAAAAPAHAPIISVTKGIEIGTNLRPTEVIANCFVNEGRKPPTVCALSGPSIASELIRHLPCSLVVASCDQGCGERVQQLLRVPWLRIYRNDDVIGVELAGATKNVIALAAGMIDGMKAGDNAKSALLARGLAEIARLGVAMGAKLDTFFGIAGVGDLATALAANGWARVSS
jgi:glycerol-3-phosphate dehydrogenase (NAD(P)+)